MSDGELAHDLRIAVLRLARRIRANRADTSLSLSQLSALAVLDAAGPMSAGDLAAAESVQPPTMTKVLAALVDRDLVSREADPDDRRAVVLAVTPAGRAVVDAERRARDAWLSAALDALDPERRDGLTALIPVLESLANAEIPPVAP